jgi:hypothetical protein
VEQRPASGLAAQSADEQTIGRYRYMLQDAGSDVADAGLHVVFDIAPLNDS